MSLSETIDDLCTQAKWSMMHDERRQAAKYIDECEERLKLFPNDEKTMRIRIKVNTVTHSDPHTSLVSLQISSKSRQQQSITEHFMSEHQSSQC
jgi:hypothetical protein